MININRSVFIYIIAGLLLLNTGITLGAQKKKATTAVKKVSTADMNKQENADRRSGTSLVSVTSVDVSFANYFALGKYRDYSTMNFGPAVQVNLQFGGIKMLRVYGIFISSYNITSGDRMDMINDFAVNAGAGLNLRLSDSFSLIPQAGYGCVMHFGYGDYHLLGEKKYHLFTDQLLSFEVEFAWHFFRRENAFNMKLFIIPSYMVFIEELHAGQEIGYRVGLGFEF